MPRDPGKHRLDDRIRAVHMLEAAQQAVAFCAGRVRADLDSDVMLRRAVVSCLQEIGEAASRISDAARARFPDIPWKKFVGTRHRLVHDYFGINLDLVWRAVQVNLPPLIEELKRGLATWPAV